MRRSLKSIAKVGGNHFAPYMAGAYEAMREKAMAQARNAEYVSLKQVHVSHARFCHHQYIRKLRDIGAQS